MSNVNANINITVDNRQALAQIRALQAQISSLNKSFAAAGGAAAGQMAALNKAMADAAVASNMFNAKIVPTTANIDRFSQSLDKGKLSLSQYVRGVASQMPGARRVFEKEFDTIAKVAESRVKSLQTQYTALGNAQKALALQPTSLAMGELATQTAIAGQKQMIMNKMIADGSTKLVNWGKNTQWAGRQLMVGFTMPLTLFGATAAKVFMDLDKQARDFKRVYGDAFTTPSEINSNLKAIQELGKEYTKYGVTLKDTMQVGATAAAAGMRNEELIAGTQESLRLATIGQIDYNQALDTTISLQTAFKMSNEELAPTVDFLGAVANQTVLTIDDMTKAIPRVAPVIQGLGGDVKDLAALLVAMREGGVSAENAANALKSGLASLINPTNNAQKALRELGIDINAIVQANKGDLMGTINDFAMALSKLGEFERQQALEKTFGKYQYARLGALFDNIIAKGGQAAVALDLAGKSAEELGQISAKSLKEIEESTTARFQGAVERLKISIAPVGEAFLKALTPVIEFITKLAEKFNELPDNIKSIIVVITGLIAGVGPIILMTIGLIANAAGNVVKFIQILRKFFARIRGDASAFDYLSNAELEAAAAAASLEGKSEKLTSTLLMQEGVVSRLIGLYERLATSAAAAAKAMPTVLGGAVARSGGKGATPLRMAKGGVVPGSGSGDKIPAILEPGETVVTKDASQKYGPVINAMNAGTLQGFQEGLGTNADFLTGVAGSTQEQFTRRQAQSVRDFWESVRHMSGAAEKASEIIANAGDRLVSASNAQRTGFIQQMKAEGFVAPNQPQSQRRYSATAAGETRSIQEQLLERGNAGAREFEAATRASEAAAEAMREYEEAEIARAIANGESDEKIAAMREKARKRIDSVLQIDRAHTVELTNQQKMLRENWGVEFWKAQSGAENQFSQILRSSQKNIDAYEQTLRSMKIQGVSEKQKNELMRKISAGLALTEKELQIQAKVLQKMLKDAQLMSTTTAGFGRFATATVAAAGARKELNTDQVDGIERNYQQQTYTTSNQGIRRIRRLRRQTGRDIASPVVEGVQDEFESQSPAEAFAREVDNAGKGMLIGAKRSKKIAATSGRILGQSAREEYKKQMSQMRRETYNIKEMQRVGLSDTQVLRQLRRLEESKARSRQAELKESEKMARTAQQNAQIASQTSRAMQQQNAGMVAQEAAVSGPGRRAKIGGAIKTGAGRAASGIGSTMVGLGTLGMFTGGGLGEVADKLFMAGIAFDSLRFAIQPLLGGFAGLAGPLSLAAAAIAGLAFVTIKGKQNVDETLNDAAEAGKKAAQSMQNIAKIGDAFGKSFMSLNVQKLGFKTQQKTQVQEYFATEQGTAEISRLSEQRSSMSREDFASTFSKDVATAAITQGLSGKQIDAYISTVAEQLNDKTLYTKVRAELAELLDPKNKEDILTNGLLIKVNAEAGSNFLKESMQIPKTTIDQLKVEMNDVFQTTTYKGVQQAAVSQADSIAQKIEQLKQEQTALSNAIAEEGTGGQAEQKYLELEQQINSLTAQLASASTEINYNNVTLDDSAQALEKATKWGTIFGASLLKGNQYLAYQKQLLDSGKISRKEYNKAIEDGNSAMSSNAYEMKRTIQILSQLDDGGESLKSFMTQISDQLFAGLDEEFKTNITNALSTIKDNNVVVDLQIAYAQGSITGQDIIDLSSVIESLPASSRSDIIVAYGNGSITLPELQYLNANMDQLAGFDGSQIDFLISVSGLDNVVKAIDIMQQINALGPITASNFMQYSALANQLADIPKDIPADTGEGEGQKDTGDVDKKGTGGAGGDKEKTGLQKLWEDIKEKLAIYTNFTDLMKKYKGQKNAFAKAIQDATYAGSIPDQLRKMNLSESLIADILAQGSKEAKKILDRLKENKKLRDQMNFGDIKAKGYEALNEVISAGRNAAMQSQAFLAAGARGQSPEVARAIADNPEIAQLYAAGTKRDKRNIEIAITTSVDNQQIMEYILDPYKLAEESIDLQKREFAVRPDILAHKEKIKLLQDQLDLVNEQISALQKLNDKDQQTIRGLERQKEMIQRQIEALERQNELDQRRIDGLRREDEIRNRVANALSHELDIMAQQEQKIRDAYDKRVKALEKVKQLNSNIIQQQRDQLNITRALGTGDIFEATAAAQQMQQNQVQFAQDQTGAAMQQGMENQIAGLRTEGGLTRQQAEQQIADIKEQSYQTGLQIQAIEDNIYNRNLQMIPLKDAIYNLDLQIQGVSDQIYNRETEILNIQNTRLDPLQQALDNEQKILDAKNEAFETEIAAQELAIERNKILDEQDRLTKLLARKTNNLANIWHDVTKQIFKANELMNNSLAALGGPPEIKPDETASDFAARVGEYTSAVADIKKRRDDAVKAAKKVGVDAMKAMGGGNRGLFAGGYVKKYAQGNYVLGSGGRDSVPAMLTPGEFIIRKAAVDKFGVPMLNSLNMGSMPKYNVPGRVFAGGSNRFDESGRRNNGGMMDSPVYNNYTVNVNVAGTNASADDIATRAITKIREMQNMQIRGNRAY